MSLAGDLDLVVGDGDDGYFVYYENTGTSTAPAFLLREGDDNPFNGIVVDSLRLGALADLDGDGTLAPCPYL